MLFQARTYSVLVVSASEKFNSSTTSLLSVTDYWPVTYADSVGLARRRLLECAYDIVLINAPLPDDFGMRLAIDICGSSQAGVLLFVKNELHDEIYSKVVEYGVMTISKPTSTQMVAQSLRLLCAVRERLRRMEERQLTVQEKIGVMATVTDVLAKYGISISSLMQPEGTSGDQVPLLIVTHAAKEVAMKQALSEIENLDCVKDKVVMFRIEDI